MMFEGRAYVKKRDGLIKEERWRKWCSFFYWASGWMSDMTEIEISGSEEESLMKFGEESV